MAAITTAQKSEGAKLLSRLLFGTQGQVANLTKTDLEGALQAVDDVMEGLASALTGADTVQKNFLDALPQTYRDNTNATEKAFALDVWTTVKFGA